MTGVTGAPLIQDLRPPTEKGRITVQPDQGLSGAGRDTGRSNP
ncbi:hypothetical protein OEM_30870 [Mycobacterium intracellulare subsp. yongonense 05-1390]|nr:hypothetical protein OEM_30870 [Mycobacterium intracellulare subsp. yongonense 05-1390]ARR78753.1 NADH dehydrogenase [Mycobacterium intracellulare subsp. yongonense]ARR83824.1 hypothetical protein MOTT27_03003 [Mycobacterium intracellulare subsp. yongonense]